MNTLKILDEYFVSIEKIKLILGLSRGQTVCIKQMINYAKEHDIYYDMSLGKKHRSLIILVDGSVILTSISAETLTKRCGNE